MIKKMIKKCMIVGPFPTVGLVIGTSYLPQLAGATKMSSR